MSEKILLTGASGLIGTSLVRRLHGKRISTISLERKPSFGPGSGKVLWDPYAASRRNEIVSDPTQLAGVTAAVHLSGANVSAKRWSPSYKREIEESRTKPTFALATLLASLPQPPSVLICASAVGIYGDRGDDPLTEASTPGTGFLAKVCVEWEAATKPASDAGIRVVHLRFGVVLARQGGALKKMLPLFRLGLGGPLGNGEQWMSWVALPDVLGAIEFALQTPGFGGAVNVVAPQCVTNLEFTRALGRALHRPAVVPVPAFALRLAFGEMADATILASQRALPSRLMAQGFSFAFPELPAALAQAG